MNIRFGRKALYPTVAAGLLATGVVIGGVLGSDPAGAQNPAASAAPAARTAAPASAEAGIIAPAPPGQPSGVTSMFTKYTTRLYGTDPFQQAVAVTQHVYTAALPLSTPNINNNDNDRPWGITLVTPDDPLAGLSAVELVHFPDDAPILFVTKTGIPQITLNEIKRLGDTGILRDNNTDIFAVGAAANPGVLNALNQKGVCSATAVCKVQKITASNDFQLADNIDKVYGSIENADTGVPQMETSASTGGNGVMDVFIGSADGTSYQYALPITHWISHMPGALLWVHRNSIPAETIDALKRRMGRAMIYVMGGPSQVSSAVVRQLNQYGSVTRITNDDPVAFNAPPKDTPVDTSIAFAKMWDPNGMVGWNITSVGHGFTLVNQNDWQGAIGSAILSHLGFHAPLILTDNASALPTHVQDYFTGVASSWLTSPADGPYNMTYVLGNYQDVSWPEQARIDFVSGANNRRVFSSNKGSVYIAPRQ